MYFPRPTSSFGYYRGSPIYQGDGSGMGQQVSGNSIFSAGQGSATASGGDTWTPTILYLFALILIEMFVFAWIGRRI